MPPASVRVVGAKASSGSKATNMVYMQMLFALFYDKVVWGSTLSPVSWAGSVLILACAVYVAVAQEERKGEKVPKAEGEGDSNGDAEEEAEGDEDDRLFKDQDDEEADCIAAGEGH